MCNCPKCPECNTHLVKVEEELGYKTTAKYWCKKCGAGYDEVA